MKANEARIGNLFQYETSDGLGYRKITAQYILDLEDNPNCDFFESIPLTEEWLVKFGLIKKYLESKFEEDGFVKNEDGTRVYTWVRGVFNLEIQSNGEIWFEVYSHYKEVKYVHELQNLYFALTGEELTLK